MLHKLRSKLRQVGQWRSIATHKCKTITSYARDQTLEARKVLSHALALVADKKPRNGHPHSHRRIITTIEPHPATATAAIVRTSHRGQGKQFSSDSCRISLVTLSHRGCKCADA